MIMNVKNVTKFRVINELEKGHRQMYCRGTFIKRQSYIKWLTFARIFAKK